MINLFGIIRISWKANDRQVLEAIVRHCQKQIPSGVDPSEKPFEYWLLKGQWALAQDILTFVKEKRHE